ncbi:MAG: tripartite tricarboxylate transporter permease, partial [Pseudomonadota bacterium]|nr:tripartite tricarboxylate transporter permease [Pseudomonadota bacterium]
MMLGGFLIHGLNPGPLLFRTNADFVYGIFAACLVANVIMLILEFFGLRIYIKLLKIPKYVLLPVVVVMCAVGAFAVRSQIFDVQMILLFGAVGYLMYKAHIPVAPAILGFILGPLVETNLRRGLMLTEGSFMEFFTRPIALVFLIAAVLALIFPLIRAVRGHYAAKGKGSLGRTG